MLGIPAVYELSEKNKGSIGYKIPDGMTKYRKGPIKDHKGALHRTTEDQQYRKGLQRNITG